MSHARIPHEHTGSERFTERRFENEPADEWNAAYGQGGPVRSDEPERDYFFESSAAPARGNRANERADRDDERRLRRMSWRAAGAQDYPGGALEQLIEASHRGKGPRGYRPSDERLREIVCERLTEDPFVDASQIDVSVANCEVTLSGSVTTRRMKFAAEELVADIPGVVNVQNSIRAGR
jgi:BON domain